MKAIYFREMVVVQVRPGVFRFIQIWLERIEWRWPVPRRAPGPRRPFDHDRDRWAW